MNHSRDTAILLVTFGTNVTQAATSFKNLEDKVRETFPDIEVRWAYTAKSIRQRLGKMGFHYDSPVTALAKLQDEGYTRVAVQSVHMIAGQEYYDLVNVAENMSHLRGISGHNFSSKIGKFGFEKLVLGKPMLYHQSDYEAVIKFLQTCLPSNSPEHALVLVGHGSEHHSFSTYGCLNDMLRRTCPNLFLGTVEGFPSLADVKEDLVKARAKEITIMPFMNIAGEHALRDLAGDEEDSWKSVLSPLFKVNINLSGLLDYEDIVKIYIDHLIAVFEELHN